MAATFAMVKTFCTIAPVTQAGDVDPGEGGDHDEADRLRGRERVAADAEEDGPFADGGQEDAEVLRERHAPPRR